jgi:2-oxoglutarate dehydrogenase complex dehydrogenase (E1) component-like enzyme
MTGKSTLRLKDACSDMSEMSTGSKFHRVIPEGHGPSADEQLDPNDQIRRTIFCSGAIDAMAYFLTFAVAPVNTGLLRGAVSLLIGRQGIL